MTPYKILTCDNPDFDMAQKAYIRSYPWGGGYVPVSYGQILLIKDKGFAVRLTAFEKDPKTVYQKYDDPVYKDSCLEFFASFHPGSPLYLNFEANSAGAFLAAVRVKRGEKTPVHKLVDIGQIPIRAKRGKESWHVEVLFTFAVLKTLFGVDHFPPGYAFSGNFYKCGDETECPHYGSFYPIHLPAPNFHCPQFFGPFLVT